jgi:uncharacterized protein (TIGR02453 family)
MWPPAALDFLRELEANNDREWFKANRSRYDESLVAPARGLADQLTHLGEPRLFRPYNNLRFRPGPPLKEHIAVAIGYGAGGAYYFELSLDGLFVGAGLHHPAADQLERFRAAVDQERKAQAFESAVAAAHAGGLSLTAPALKRAPRGYPNDHPRVDYLRLKSITVSHRHPLEGWLHKPECDRRVKSELGAAAPLVRWLAETVGPSKLPARG